MLQNFVPPYDAHVIERLKQRNGLSEEEARKRISSQMDRSERLEKADVVIDNSSDVAGLEGVVKELWDSRVEGRIGKT